MKAGKAEKAQVKLCDTWNRDHRPGFDVIVTLDDGSKKQSKTLSEAFMLGKCREYPGHTAMISLEGISGCYMLERVQPGQKPTCTRWLKWAVRG